MNSRWLLYMQEPDFRKNFGGRLKELRKQRHWSQKDLAAKLNIRFQQLNKYESGLNMPPAEMLLQIAQALSCTVDYLLNGHPAEAVPFSSTKLYYRFQAVDTFPIEDQEAVIKLIDAMIAKHQVEQALRPINN